MNEQVSTDLLSSMGLKCKGYEILEGGSKGEEGEEEVGWVAHSRGQGKEGRGELARQRFSHDRQ